MSEPNYKRYDYYDEEDKLQIYQQYHELDEYSKIYTPEEMNEKFGTQWEIHIVEDDLNWDYIKTRVYIVYWVTETEADKKERLRRVEFNKKVTLEEEKRREKLNKYYSSEEFKMYRKLSSKVEKSLKS